MVTMTSVDLTGQDLLEAIRVAQEIKLTDPSKPTAKSMVADIEIGYDINSGLFDLVVTYEFSSGALDKLRSA